MYLSWMRNKLPLFAPEGEGAGAGGEGTSTVAGADQQTILYGNDTPAGGAEETPAPAAGEWKEYEPDAAKSDEENAAAKAEHDKTKPAAPDALDAVPEDGNYASMITLPDGMVMDEVMLGALAPAMKEAGITGKQANTLAAAFAAQRQAEVENWGKTVGQWAKDAQVDPEIGGVNWDATKANSQKFIAQFGTPALKEYLNATGAGNHPELIRIMAKAGAAISEDTPTSHNQGGPAKDAATVLYPDDQPKG